MTLGLPKQCAFSTATVVLVHVGSPVSDDRQRWGPEILLVDGARVVKPADAARPATYPTTSTSMPWPSNFLRYLSSLDGVKVVAGPSPVTIGGVKGRGHREGAPMHPLI